MINAQTSDPFLLLSRKLGRRWPAIRRARKEALSRKDTLRISLQEGNLISRETGMVVFGSLARNEWTSGSDVDWTLLVDGQADPTHLQIAQRIDDFLLKGDFRKPGPTGIFGNLAFSHDIIHNIGGEADTNRNMTRRILLLLESSSIGPDIVRDRVIRGILNRYLEEDPSFISPHAEHRKLPRFLLNDVVRFWRTMAVDFACKRRERAGKGWALRNIKLRMSRKLIFVSGLFMCFSCLIRPPKGKGMSHLIYKDSPSLEPLIDHLAKLVQMTPLGIVCQVLLDYASRGTACQLLDAYDQFLALMDNPKYRNHLDCLPSEKSRIDPIFEGFHAVSHRFQSALFKVFFDDKQLSRLFLKYGVF